MAAYKNHLPEKNAINREICIDYMVKRVPYCTNIKKVAHIEYVGIHGPAMEQTPRR